jgi:ATP adenylyltransferase/5',5'''-P-1,P-4-tetraphosphate phosphorylase II
VIHQQRDKERERSREKTFKRQNKKNIYYLEKKERKELRESIKRKQAQKKKITREEEKNIEAPFLPYTINDVADHNNNEQPTTINRASHRRQKQL